MRRDVVGTALALPIVRFAALAPVVLPSLTVDSSLVLYRGGGQLGTDWRVVAARPIVARRVMRRFGA